MNGILSGKLNEKEHLEIGGADCVELAERFSTPLYVYDEARIRTMMRVFRDTIQEEYGGNGAVYYASKAFSCKAMYAIAKSEGLGADVVSGGELYTALQAGFPAERICFHGNNKLPHELSEALDCGVGRFVIDSEEEIARLDAAAAQRNVSPRVLLRINPGVEAHTHAYVQTATPDCKFGFSVASGAAEEMTRRILSAKHLRLVGFHCHIGSQIFGSQSFTIAVEKCTDYLETVKAALGFEAEEMNFGGGYGIRYNEDDPVLRPQDYRAVVCSLISALKEQCAKRNLRLPRLCIEPGRSVVGEAGVTLYTVGSVKKIKGLRTYVAVDGGMGDNPRYCLYGAKYAAVLANRAAELPSERVAVAGKCCESGDLLGVDFNLPRARAGDILAVFSTGAYNYSMASNYNRNPVPPAVLVKDGKARLIIRPQTYADIVRNDVLPEDI